MIDASHTMPKDKDFAPLPADTYHVQVNDIDYEIKPSTFKKKDGSPQEDSREYHITFVVLDKGEFYGREFQAWIRESLIISKRSKRPSLVEFLRAITGQEFTKDDNAKVTGQFMNGLIGSQLRVSTRVEDSMDGTKKYTRPVSYLAVKEQLPPFDSNSTQGNPI